MLTVDAQGLRVSLTVKVRELRRSRRMTQADLGAHLRISGARVGRIERGLGSYTAEQLLVMLTLFNVDVGQIMPPTCEADELQNALVRHGADHLRRVPDVILTGRYATPSDAILSVLLDPRSARFVTALGPVLVKNVDVVSLPALRHQLARSGRPRRLDWLVENVLYALLQQPASKDAEVRRQVARAVLVLGCDLRHLTSRGHDEALDLFDPTIRSEETMNLVWDQRASSASRRWGIVTDILVDDFADAITSASVLTP